MGSVFYQPDRAIVAQLQAIDPKLSVEFDEDLGRWCVYHDLQQPEGVDKTAHALAREAFYDFRAGGYETPYHRCLAAAYMLIEREKLVCIVQNDDQTYRPLDGRLIAKFRRMAWLQQNWDVKDWVQTAKAQSDQLRATKRRDGDTIWDSIKRDKVLARQVQNVLDGTQHSRPFSYVNRGESHAAAL